MNTCKYCHGAILWQDRRPLNPDSTPHDFAFCQARKRKNKLARSVAIAERHRREALAIIRENARVAAERGFKQPSNPYARDNQPIVTDLLEGTAKVEWAAEYIGILASGERCRVAFLQGGISGGMYARPTNSSAIVKPYSKRKKDVVAFNAALAEVSQ